MFDTLTSTLVSLALSIINFFPESPIQPAISNLSTTAFGHVLGVVNYIVPIGTMLSIFSAWLAAVAAYYVYQIIMRWVKVID